ncbi:flagellar biosynthetic protein FliO [Bacillus sp. 1P06AnD]|uniref:flagellar biosynthetic protein FliO n=1 Tax=Bacillus sp. 1P06AnD TaxID=3132208 RepID=UPI0039A3529F
MAKRTMRSFIAILMFSLFFSINSGTYVHAAGDNGNETVEQYLEQQKNKGKTEKKEVKEEPSSEVDSAPTVGFTDILRLLAAFLFVIGLLYLLLKFINKRTKGYQKGNLIQNLGGTSLGNSKSIQIVKIGTKLYIIGVGENVQLLNEITDEDEMETILSEYNSAADRAMAPADIVSKWVGRKKDRDDKETTVSFTEQFKEQLSQMAANRKAIKEEYKKKVETKDE